MKCLVAVKRVIAPYAPIRINSDHSGVVTNNLTMSMNPFDEIAIEQAKILKEQGLCSEIIVVSIGSIDFSDTLREALARGADKAILVKTEAKYSSLNIAKILKWLVLREQPDLVLLGKQAIDNDCNQTGQMLAGLLDWGQATFASNIDLDIANKVVQVSREVDDGIELLQVMLPAVVTVDLRLNEPSYISLPNLMKAKMKPLEILELNKLELDLPEQIEVLEVTSPPARTSGIIVNNVDELIEYLKIDGCINNL